MGLVSRGWGGEGPPGGGREETKEGQGGGDRVAVGRRTGADWRREELEEERGWAQGCWGKDHQEEEEKPEEKREESGEGGAYGRERGTRSSC